MSYWYLFAVWIHLLAAITWIGSMVFLVVVLVPTLREHNEPKLTSQFMLSAGLRLRFVGWILFALLALTGIAAVSYRGYTLADAASGSLFRGFWGHVLGAKILLFVVVLGVSYWHDFRLGPKASQHALSAPGSQESTRLRRRASWCGRVILLLALAIVALGVVLVRGWPS